MAIQEYEINATYQEARFKAVCAVLKTKFDIDIEDFVGVTRIFHKGEKIATIDLREKNETTKT